MLGRLRRLSQGIEYRGAFDCHGGLLMARKMRNRRFVEPPARVDIDRVDYIVRSL